MEYQYLRKIEHVKIEPNFFISKEYFEMKNVEEIVEKDVIHIMSDGVDLCPPFSLNSGICVDKVKVVLTDFYGNQFSGRKEFFDWEYLFDPNGFLNMGGGRWEVFRKNCRKWSRRNEGWEYKYLTGNEYENDIERLLLRWVEKVDNRMVYDDEVMVKYLFFGRNRKVLLNKSKIVGINVWDKNYKYINYRYCINHPEERFLNEFLRLLFYTDDCIINENKFVNDGGVVGNDGLEKFKDKMNPIRKRGVYSWFVE